MRLRLRYGDIAAPIAALSDNLPPRAEPATAKARRKKGQKPKRAPRERKGPPETSTSLLSKALAAFGLLLPHPD